jgi:hypothetical protein
MTELVKLRFQSNLILLALIGLGMGSHSVSAATTVVLKNNWPAAAEIGFDGAPATKVATGDTARVTLNDGQHSIQCRFEGIYDGCNMADRFAIEGARELTLTLVPVFALPHAVALSQQGTLSIETRQDGAWATKTLDVPGAAADCADYSSGKLGAVSQALRSRVPVRNATVATLNLCGQQHPAIGTMMGGAQVYIPLRFVRFKERNERAVVVRQ